jgi:hypothetical protein
MADEVDDLVKGSATPALLRREYGRAADEN